MGVTMKLIRIGITLLSPLGTALKSDTLSGHLLCLYRQRYGEKELLQLLSAAGKGQLPFVISDAFPHGHLPVPLLEPLSRRVFKELVDELHSGKMLIGLKSLKKFRKKNQFLALKEWREISGKMSAKNLYFLHDQNRILTESGEITAFTLHNTIDRQSGQVREGALYQTRDLWYAESVNKPTLDIYAKVLPDFESKFKQLLSDLSELGYGRDRSSGKGNLQFGEWEELPDLDQGSRANAWMNLSTYSTTHGEDLTGGWYRMQTKFGKILNGFGERNPFKKPLIVFEPGSVFPKMPENMGASVISGIHAENQNVVQYCCPVMLPLTLETTA